VDLLPESRKATTVSDELSGRLERWVREAKAALSRAA
jgi:hypothetical protein